MSPIDFFDEDDEMDFSVVPVFPELIEYKVIPEQTPVDHAIVEITEQVAEEIVLPAVIVPTVAILKDCFIQFVTDIDYTEANDNTPTYTPASYTLYANDPKYWAALDSISFTSNDDDFDTKSECSTASTVSTTSTTASIFVNAVRDALELAPEIKDLHVLTELSTIWPKLASRITTDIIHAALDFLDQPEVIKKIAAMQHHYNQSPSSHGEPVKFEGIPIHIMLDGILYEVRAITMNTILVAITIAKMISNLAKYGTKAALMSINNWFHVYPCSIKKNMSPQPQSFASSHKTGVYVMFPLTYGEAMKVMAGPVRKYTRTYFKYFIDALSFLDKVAAPVIHQSGLAYGAKIHIQTLRHSIHLIYSDSLSAPSTVTANYENDTNLTSTDFPPLPLSSMAN
jgi:hypothetical protein